MQIGRQRPIKYKAKSSNLLSKLYNYDLDEWDPTQTPTNLLIIQNKITNGNRMLQNLNRTANFRMMCCTTNIIQCDFVFLWDK